MKSLVKSSINSLIIRRLSSYTYLNTTQFLGALNDNIYKLLIVYFFIQLEGIQYSHIILAMTGATFVLPFILFSASSGTLADRFSKRNIIVCTKVFELSIMLLGILAFHFQSKWGLLGCLFLLATHSAIFAPSKYGILPELVSSDKITRANGLMTSFTFLAIILGTFTASFVLDITGRDFIIAAILCACLSFLGLMASLCIEYTDPAGSTKGFNVMFLKEIFQTLKLTTQVPSLLMCSLGSAFFLFLGAFAQLNIIPFAVQSLNLSDVQGGYLFLLTAIGIGMGSLLAGKISGKSVELGLVPLAALGVGISSYMLDFFSSNLLAVIALVVILGMFGGMYQIPLDSYVQLKSPNQYRGQIVAATNFLSFCGVLLASLLVYMVTEVFGLSADKGFVIIGTITLGVTCLVTYQLFDYFARFIAMILSRFHFQLTFMGLKNVPEGPAVYVCHHQAWNETLILLGSQRLRLRFFIESEQEHTRWMKRFYRLLRVVLIPTPEPLNNSPKTLKQISNTLANGISVCIFVAHSDVIQEIEKLKKAYSLQDILNERQVPVVPVVIEKGEKTPLTPFFKRFLKKFRVPAAISFGEVQELSSK